MSVSWLLILIPLVAIFSTQTVHAQLYFTDCLSNGNNNATVVIPETISVSAFGSEDALESGDQIAVFTEDDECAGAGVWTEEEPLSIPVAGSDQFSPGGFTDGEVMSYRVWNASTGSAYLATVTMARCLFGCPAGSGVYAGNEVYIADSLEASPDDRLPVELTRFAATLNGAVAMLIWDTASETNNAGFEVEHQRVTAPAPGEWTRLAFVAGRGTTSDEESYRFATPNLSPGTHRFRLKQIDLDGAFSYSDAVEVEVALDSGFRLIDPYPNPFRTQATMEISVAQTQDVNVELCDVLGQRVAILHRATITARNPLHLHIDGSDLASGIYFIRVTGETMRTTRRLVIAR